MLLFSAIVLALLPAATALDPLIVGGASLGDDVLAATPPSPVLAWNADGKAGPLLDNLFNTPTLLAADNRGVIYWLDVYNSIRAVPIQPRTPSTELRGLSNGTILLMDSSAPAASSLQAMDVYPSGTRVVYSNGTAIYSFDPASTDSPTLFVQMSKVVSLQYTDNGLLFLRNASASPSLYSVALDGSGTPNKLATLGGTLPRRPFRMGWRASPSTLYVPLQQGLLPVDIDHAFTTAVPRSLLTQPGLAFSSVAVDGTANTLYSANGILSAMALPAAADSAVSPVNPLGELVLQQTAHALAPLYAPQSTQQSGVLALLHWVLDSLQCPLPTVAVVQLSYPAPSCVNQLSPRMVATGEPSVMLPSVLHRTLSQRPFFFYSPAAVVGCDTSSDLLSLRGVGDDVFTSTSLHLHALSAIFNTSSSGGLALMQNYPGGRTLSAYRDGQQATIATTLTDIGPSRTYRRLASGDVFIYTSKVLPQALLVRVEDGKAGLFENLLTEWKVTAIYNDFLLTELGFLTNWDFQACSVDDGIISLSALRANVTMAINGDGAVTRYDCSAKGACGYEQPCHQQTLGYVNLRGGTPAIAAINDTAAYVVLPHGVYQQGNGQQATLVPALPVGTARALLPRAGGELWAVSSSPNRIVSHMLGAAGDSFDILAALPDSTAIWAAATDSSNSSSSAVWLLLEDGVWMLPSPGGDPVLSIAFGALQSRSASVLAVCNGTIYYTYLNLQFGLDTLAAYKDGSTTVIATTDSEESLSFMSGVACNASHVFYTSTTEGDLSYLSVQRVADGSRQTVALPPLFEHVAYDAARDMLYSHSTTNGDVVAISLAGSPQLAWARDSGLNLHGAVMAVDAASGHLLFASSSVVSWNGTAGSAAAVELYSPQLTGVIAGEGGPQQTLLLRGFMPLLSNTRSLYKYVVGGAGVLPVQLPAGVAVTDAQMARTPSGEVVLGDESGVYAVAINGSSAKLIYSPLLSSGRLLIASHDETELLVVGSGQLLRLDMNDLSVISNMDTPLPACSYLAAAPGGKLFCTAGAHVWQLLPAPAAAVTKQAAAANYTGLAWDDDSSKLLALLPPFVLSVDPSSGAVAQTALSAPGSVGARSAPGLDVSALPPTRNALPPVSSKRTWKVLCGVEGGSTPVGGKYSPSSGSPTVAIIVVLVVAAVLLIGLSAFSVRASPRSRDSEMVKMGYSDLTE